MKTTLAAVILALAVPLAFVIDDPTDNPSQKIARLGLLFLALIFYFLPTISALRREHQNQQAIAVLNLFGGWTVLGWIAALVWAFKK